MQLLHFVYSTHKVVSKTSSALMLRRKHISPPIKIAGKNGSSLKWDLTIENINVSLHCTNIFGMQREKKAHPY